MTAEPTAVAMVRDRIGPLGVWCTTDPLTQPMMPEHPLRIDDEVLAAVRAEVG